MDVALDGTSDAAARAALIRRGLRLNYLTIGYNAVEAAAALIAGFLASSAALIGFGFDSVIEVSASLAAQWRLRVDGDALHRERVEVVARRIVGACFLALAAYVAYDSLTSLLLREAPERSLPGTIVLALSVVVMPLLARAKRRVARSLNSRALESEAAQTSLCAYLSVIALAGVALNAGAGWWWADPVAALAMIPIIAMEGLEGLRGEACDDACR
ncbi:MAG TPA: cation transporter [Gemmatimonadaceae bacterium]|nr:cation transporter [Gemmatimonadaceae bacterium]